MEFAVDLPISSVNVTQDLKEQIVPKLFVKSHAMKTNIVMFLPTSLFVNVSQAMEEQVVLSNYVKMIVQVKESARMEYVYAIMVSEETVAVSSYVLKTVLRMGSVKKEFANVLMDMLANTVKKRVVL